MNIEDIFNEVSVQMRSDFEKSKRALSHSGLKGTSNEEVVKEFLRQYLPRSLEISTGLVVDANGTVSKQLDIIIHDAARTPVFFQSQEIRVIPVECIYAVVEVKAFLDKSELDKAFQNMQSVKNLEKKAFFEPKSPIIETKFLYGCEWMHWPVNYFVFAFDSPSLESVQSNLQELELNTEVHKRVDSVCILNKGVIFNQSSDENLTALPAPDTFRVNSATQKPLLLFYTLISIILNQASMNTFNIHPYIAKLKF